MGFFSRTAVMVASFCSKCITSLPSHRLVVRYFLGLNPFRASSSDRPFHRYCPVVVRRRPSFCQVAVYWLSLLSVIASNGNGNPFGSTETVCHDPAMLHPDALSVPKSASVEQVHLIIQRRWRVYFMVVSSGAVLFLPCAGTPAGHCRPGSCECLGRNIHG